MKSFCYVYLMLLAMFALVISGGMVGCFMEEAPASPVGPVGAENPEQPYEPPPGNEEPGGPGETGGEPPAGDPPPGGGTPGEGPPPGPGNEPPSDPPPPPPPSGGSDGIWISRDEIQGLPMSGPAWNALLDQANSPAGTPDLSDQDQNNNVYVLAKALVYARTGETSYRDEVVENCMAAIDTELGGRTLALGRELAAYVIAADLVVLDREDDEVFRAWLRRTLTEELSGKTLQSTHEDRPNNWGTHAGASRAAVAVYLDDVVELERTAQVFEGWLGNRDAYAGFDYGDLSWQHDAAHPVGVNPAGATKEGVSIDGALPDDMRRGCPFRDPPCHTGYAWEGLQGALVQAEILHRAGYDVWNWSDQAMRRAVQYLDDLDQRLGGWWAEGDDEWQVWIVNHAYGAGYPAENPARFGKNMGWTDWTHDR